METQIWYLPMPAGWAEGELNKGTVMPASTHVPERIAPTALSLMPDNPLPPCMSLAIFELLSVHWSLGQLFVSDSLLEISKKTPGSTEALYLSWMEFLLIFTARNLGTPLPSTDASGWGA